MRSFVVGGSSGLSGTTSRPLAIAIRDLDLWYHLNFSKEKLKKKRRCKGKITAFGVSVTHDDRASAAKI